MHIRFTHTHKHIHFSIHGITAQLYFVQQELNNRLSAEITRMRSCFSGETALSPLTQGKDVYELEVGVITQHAQTHTRTPTDDLLFNLTSVCLHLVGVAAN